MLLQLKQCSAALAVAAGCLTLATAQAPARQVATGKPVALTPDACVAISPGDTLTLKWDPAFNHAEAVQGLREFSLLFARSGEDSHALRGHGGIRLQAVTSHGQLSKNSASAMHDGVFHVTFRPDLSAVEPGNYYLVGANATARTDPNYSGDLPAMAHSPAGSGFCLVVSTAQGDTISRP